MLKRLRLAPSDLKAASGGIRKSPVRSSRWNAGGCELGQPLSAMAWCELLVAVQSCLSGADRVNYFTGRSQKKKFADLVVHRPMARKDHLRPCMFVNGPHG
jgi:hypothetical protein